MWCDLAKWAGTGKHWFWGIDDWKEKKSFVFYCFTKPSTCILGTNQPIFMGFSSKCGIKNA